MGHRQPVAVHVSVLDGNALRERVDSLGRHADTAFRAGLHPARLSQILSGTSPSITMEQAARLEVVLGVEIGTFFKFDADPELVRAYLKASAGVGAA